MLFAILACCNDGDEIVVVEPFYTNYLAFATMAGARLVPIAAKGEDGFHLPPRPPSSASSPPRTRLALIRAIRTTPPARSTGRAELEEVAGFCREHGLFLIADEVYREFVYDGRRRTTAPRLPGCEDQASWSTACRSDTPPAGCASAASRPATGRSTTRCCAWPRGACRRRASPSWWRSGPAELGPDYAKGVVREYQARRDVLFEGLSRLPGVFLRKPEGAFYFVARLPITDGEDFARACSPTTRTSGAR